MKTAQEIGSALQAKREELKISLREAENATSIRMSYLELLEAGQVDKLLSPVYAKGFLKQYAYFLGFDGDQLVNEYQELFNVFHAQEFDYGIGTLEVRDNGSSSLTRSPLIFWLVVAGGVSVIFFFIATFFGWL